MKTIMLTAGVLMTVVLFTAPVNADTAPAVVPAAAVAAPVEVGNKICPVSGEKIDGSMGETPKIEHNGKLYNLCCGMCVKDFNQDPDKYSAIADQEVAAQ